MKKIISNKDVLFYIDTSDDFLLAITNSFCIFGFDSKILITT